jgi:chromate transporter
MLFDLFITFLKIGAVSFGGGYGMLSLMREECLAHAWLSEAELLNFIAVAESTPGPIAINMATFVGSSQAGILGAVFATLGVVLPSFVIILLIAAVFTRLMRFGAVKATLGGIRPCIVGLILATAFTMLLSIVFGIKDVFLAFAFDYRALCVLVVIAALSFAFSKFKGRALSPIILILISGVLGVLLYGV